MDFHREQRRRSWLAWGAAYLLAKTSHYQKRRFSKLHISFRQAQIHRVCNNDVSAQFLRRKASLPEQKSLMQYSHLQSFDYNFAFLICCYLLFLQF